MASGRKDKEKTRNEEDLANARKDFHGSKVAGNSAAIFSSKVEQNVKAERL